MTKQEKIEKLSKQIEKLTKELNDVVNEPEIKEVQCYGDSAELGSNYLYLNCEGLIRRSLHDYSCTEINRNTFHNLYEDGKALCTQINYQRIINRMWQLAYELNPKDWDWKKEAKYGEGVYELRFNPFASAWVRTCHLFCSDDFSPVPKFKNLEDAVKAADQLNQDGYRL